MPWSTPTAADVLQEFTPAEEAALRDLQEDADGELLAAIVARVVAEIRAAIQAGGYRLADDETTVPLGLHTACIDLARWRYIVGGRTAGQVMQTEERRKAKDEAKALIADLRAQRFPVDSPDGIPPSPATRAGSWNSDQKILGRTHPHPPPAWQYPAGQPAPYANPNAPEDTAGTPSEDEP